MPVCAAALASCFLLSLALTALGFLSMCGDPAQLVSPAFFMAALLLSLIMLLFPSITADHAGCAALSFGLCLIQAAFGGGILPEALLPEVLAKISVFMPLSIMRRLLSDAAFGCGFDQTAAAVVWCVLMLVICAAFWLGKGAEA